MPQRILRYLEMVERTAKTASSVLDCLKKIAAIALMCVIGFSVVQACSASSHSSNQASARDEAVTLLAKKLELSIEEHRQTRAFLGQIIKQFSGEPK